MADTRTRAPWSWYGLALAFAALIGFAFYSECAQGDSQRRDAHRALRCLLGPPPVAAAEVDARYRARRDAAHAEGGRYPQACRAAVASAARYHGNASSAPLQFALEDLARLLAADDAHLADAAVRERLGRIVVLAGFDAR